MFKWLKKSTATGVRALSAIRTGTDLRAREDSIMKKAHHAQPAIRSGLRRPVDAPRGEGCPSPASITLSMRLRIVATSISIERAKEGTLLTRVASAYLRNWYCLVPSGTSLRGLKVRVLPLRSACDQRRSMPAFRGASISQAEERRHFGVPGGLAG